MMKIADIEIKDIPFYLGAVPEFIDDNTVRLHLHVLNFHIKLPRKIKFRINEHQHMFKISSTS